MRQGTSGDRSVCRVNRIDGWLAIFIPTSMSNDLCGPRIIYRCNRANTASTLRWGDPVSSISSFAKIDVTCFSTEPTPTTSAVAIPWFVRPSAISPRTSRSRAVSAVSGSRRRANICRTTCSSSTVPPAAIRVTASRSSSRDEIRSFSKYPTPESPAAGDRSDAPGASPRVVEQRQRDMWSYVDPSARPVARPEGLHLNLCGGYPSLIFPAATRKCGLKTE
jgi:hypothetical protein